MPAITIWRVALSGGRARRALRAVLRLVRRDRGAGRAIGAAVDGNRRDRPLPGRCMRAAPDAGVRDGDRQAATPARRVRVVMKAGTWVTPASGVTAATGKVTLLIRPTPFRRGPIILATTATPTDRPAVTKQVTLPAC